METTEDYLIVFIKIFGTLGLLIYGMKMMSDALQKMTGPQLRHILGRMTTNRVTGMFTGMLVTCAVQSSSATTVMTVSFVSAGLLTLTQAISVIMGANIGTTLTAWIMSLGYNVDLTNVVFPAFFFGLVLIYRKRYRNIGNFIFGIAFLFLSLVMLSEQGKALDLENNADVVSFFASFDTSSYLTILIFLAIGTVITCIVQSSAAVMAITIMLCSTGVLPIHLGIALVMGENIGTTATANLAALGANTEARRAALAHLLFKVTGVLWVLIVFYPFVDMVCGLAGYNPSAGGQAERLPIVLAMFHTCFNVCNTLLLIGFIPQLEKLVRRILPSKSMKPKDGFRMRYIGSTLMQTPELSLLAAQKETQYFSSRMVEMFEKVADLIKSDKKDFDKIYDQIVREEDLSDHTELEIANYIGQLSQDHLSDETKQKIRSLLREISELESISDSCYKLARSVHRLNELNLSLTDTQSANITKMMGLTAEAIQQMHQVMKGKDNRQTAREGLSREQRNQNRMGETHRIENDINAIRNRLKSENIAAVNRHEYDYVLGTIYIDIILECERLGDYVVNVVQARLEMK